MLLKKQKRIQNDLLLLWRTPSPSINPLILVEPIKLITHYSFWILKIEFWVNAKWIIGTLFLLWEMSVSFLIPSIWIACNGQDLFLGLNVAADAKRDGLACGGEGAPQKSPSLASMAVVWWHQLTCLDHPAWHPAVKLSRAQIPGWKGKVKLCWMIKWLCIRRCLASALNHRIISGRCI